MKAHRCRAVEHSWWLNGVQERTAHTLRVRTLRQNASMEKILVTMETPGTPDETAKPCCLDELLRQNQNWWPKLDLSHTGLSDKHAETWTTGIRFQ